MRPLKLPFGFVLARPQPKTGLHPDMKTAIEFAFTCEGKDYYTFKKAMDVPAKRFQRANEFMREAELRMTASELMEYLKVIKAALDKGKLTSVMQMVQAIETRATQFIETDTFYRLFSCMFFTLDEDVTDYDFDLNDDKIASFKRGEPAEDFFFREPMKKYLPPIDISKKDLKIFFLQTKVHKEFIQKISSKILTELEENGKGSGGS